MNRILKLMITCVFALGAWLPSMTGAAFAASAPTEEWTKYPLIAHALGGIDGVDYTNSLEAFKTNYDKGQRVFEVDLSLTQDGQLAARHDWEGYLATKFEQNIPADQLNEPLTLKEFKGYKILKDYTPLSFMNVVRILEKYPDVYFITDTKETDPALVQKQFTLIKDTVNKVDPALLDRLIPEIYSPEMMTQVKNLVPFKHVIFSIYMSSMEPNEVAKYVKENQIHVVAMPFERATRSYMKKLSDAGAVVYVHSLNNVDDVNKYLAMGVHGVYTDFLSYKDLGIDTTAWTQPVTVASAAPANPAASNTEAAATPDSSTAVSGNAVAAEPKPSAWEMLKSILSDIFSI